MSREMALIEGVTREMIIHAFTEPDGLQVLEAKAEAAIAEHKPDTATPKGRGEIKSLAYKMAQLSVAVDNIGKEAVAPMKEKIKLIDAGRRSFRNGMAEKKTRVREPLTHWENDEKHRINRHKHMLQQIEFMGHTTTQDGTLILLENLREQMTKIQAVETGPSWEEFEALAEKLVFQSYRRVQNAIDVLVKQADERRELERLQDEEAERERLVQEAKEQAAQELHDKEIAENAEKKEREKRIAAEKKAEEAIKEADRAKEWERQAVIDATHKEEQAEEQAKQRANQIAAEKLKAEARDRRQRQADIKHVNNVHEEAAKVISSMFGFENVYCLPIIEAIARGDIPNVTIKY